MEVKFSGGESRVYTARADEILYLDFFVEAEQAGDEFNKKMIGWSEFGNSLNAFKGRRWRLQLGCYDEKNMEIFNVSASSYLEEKIDFNKTLILIFSKILYNLFFFIIILL